MRRLTLFALPLLLAGCNAVNASVDGGYGDYHFHDIRKPHGHARSVTALQADAGTCMARTGHSDSLAELPATERDPRYKACLLAHGWRFYAYTPPAAPVDHEEEETTPISDSGPAHDSGADIAAMNQAQSDAANAQALQASIDASNAIQDAAMVGR